MGEAKRRGTKEQRINKALKCKSAQKENKDLPRQSNKSNDDMSVNLEQTTKRLSKNMRMSVMIGLLYGSVSMIKTEDQIAREDYERKKY